MTKANLREFPSTSSAILVELSEGDVVRLGKHAPVGGWYEVTDTNSRNKGWIRGDLLSLSSDGSDAHPLAPTPQPSYAPRPTPAPAPAETAFDKAIVWVNTASGVYHCRGTRWYGVTKVGEYMTQVKTGGPVQPESLVNRTVQKVRQAGAKMNLDFKDGSSAEIPLAEATSSVMLRDKDNKMEYAD